MKGLDLLGLAHPKFKAKEALKGFPRGFALGCFDDPKTFGDALKRIKLFLNSGKVAALRVHVHWSDAHKIADLKDLKRRLPRYEKLQKEYPHIPVYVSHSCEYKESSLAEVRKRVELVRSLCPSCEVVQSAWQGPVVPGVGVIEKHGPGAKCGPGMIASYDGGGEGEGVTEVDTEKWFAKNGSADITFAWIPLFNLTESKKLPRPQRTASPTTKDVAGVARICFPKDGEPADLPGVTIKPVKRPVLYKSWAEDNPGESKRDKRPLIILPKKTASVEVLASNGQRIGRFMYFGTFTGGMHRYYAGLPGGINLYAYEIAAKAKQISGSEWGYIKQGSTYYKVQFAFRSGYFQENV